MSSLFPSEPHLLRGWVRVDVGGPRVNEHPHISASAPAKGLANPAPADRGPSARLSVWPDGLGLLECTDQMDERGNVVVDGARH